MNSRTGKILVIGTAGQVGTDLTPALRATFGAENVVAAAHRTPPHDSVRAGGPFVILDATDREALRNVVQRHAVKEIYHLPAVMSAAGEQDPARAWTINVETLRNVLDLGVELGLSKIFWPSSIAVFGPTTPRRNTPQRTVLEPTTIYGIAKLTGENLCHYYHRRYGLDVRSLRYPGLVTYKTFSGGGTTDYSVEMFLEARKTKRYTCFVRADTRLPLMYMDDAIKATVQLMQADSDRIGVRTSYNLAALSFTAGELAAEIARRVDGFTCDYVPDRRQAIADSWPETVDDSAARNDWGWRHDYDLRALADAMLKGLASPP
jgi:nucleoside-diphosphate-sugar epimerase